MAPPVFVVDEMNRLLEIAVLVQEHESDIKETAQSVGPERMYQDLELLQSKLKAVSSFFMELAEFLREISSKL